MQIKGKQIRDNTVTGDDVNEDTLILKYFTTHKYTNTSGNDEKLIKFNAAGSDNTGGSQVNNKFVAPANGKLIKIMFRSTGTPGNTELALLKITNGTENFGSPISPVSDVSIDAATANTTYVGVFSTNNTFNAGDVLGIRINPANNHGNVDLTIVWEFDWNS